MIISSPLIPFLPFHQDSGRLQRADSEHGGSQSRPFGALEVELALHRGAGSETRVEHFRPEDDPPIKRGRFEKSQTEESGSTVFLEGLSS